MEKIIRYLNQIFRVSIPEKQVLQQLYNEYRSSLIKSYKISHTQKFIKSLSVNSLLKKSVQLYVGSKALPRNDVIMKMLLQQATNKAQAQNSIREQLNVKYYTSYFVKLDAMKQDNPIKYQYASDVLMELAEQGHQLSNYLVGKQLYKLIQTGQTGDFSAQSLVQKCRDCFITSISDSQYGGLYYIADMIEKDGIQNTDLKQDDIFQMYIHAASLGQPLALFKLAMIYRKQFNTNLYKKYLMQAAQKGVIQAKHNLGHQYLSGQFFPKNQVKALAWFTNAAAHGFVFSKYNIYKLWLNGSSCGKIKPNKQAALIYLEQINRQSSELNVEEQLKELVQQISQKKSV